LGEDFFHDVTAVDVKAAGDAHGWEENRSSLWAAINRLVELQSLSVEIRGETRKLCLVDLDKLQHLHTVRIYGDRATMSKDDFHALSRFPKLGQLTVRGVDLHDDSLAELAASQGLWSIDFGITNVTDRGLRQLSSLKNLKYVELDQTNVTDEGIKQLRDLPLLQRLQLGDTNLTGRALEGFPSLEYVNLWTSDTDGRRAIGVGYVSYAKRGRYYLNQGDKRRNEEIP
jgi:hypothetical protein